jgi:hypothetical protein
MNLRSLFTKKTDPAIQFSIKLKQLSKVPLAHRNIEWDKEFMANLGEAHLASKIPQVAVGEDGFQYFQLEIPDVGAPFQAYTVSKLIEDHLLKDGLGITVSSYGEKPDMRFSYGELLNYHYRKSFRSNQQNWLAPSPNQFSGNEEILGGDPAPSILHPLTRKILLAYMVKNGFHFPKVAHMNILTENGIMNQLVFNLVPSFFQNEKHFQDVLSSLKWYLPVHYTYTAIPEHYLGDLFFDL